MAVLKYITSIVWKKWSGMALLCSQLISIHAITVSGITSRIFGVDKRLLSGCLQKENLFSILCQRIHSPEPDKLGYRRSQVMAMLFGVQNTNSLATMRHNTFSKKNCLCILVCNNITSALNWMFYQTSILRRAYYQVMMRSQSLFLSSSFSICQGWCAARNFFTASSDSHFHPPMYLVFFFQSSSYPAFLTSLLTHSSHLSIGLSCLLLPCSRL